MSLGQAEGVIGVISTILNRFSSGFVAFGTCFSVPDVRFNINLETSYGVTASRGILALAGQ